MAVSLKKFYFTKLSDLLFVGFMSSISVALLNGVWSLYFNSFFHNISLVGYFSTILSLVSLIMFFILTPIIEKYKENKVYFLALFASILILLFFSLNKNFYLFVIFVVIYIIMAVLRAESFGIMVRNESKTKFIGKNEGLNYTLSNFGWIIGSLLIIPLLKIYDFPAVFIFSALFVLISLIVFLLYKKDVKKYKSKAINLYNNLKNFFKNKELKLLYFISTGISSWLGFVFVYIPLYIVKNNFDKSFVGVFLFIFLLPFLLQSIVGKKSDLIGSKFFIVLGYLIMSVFTILIFFTNHVNNVLLLLVLGSFGASFLEVTKEIHFFKTIKKVQEEHYYGIYLTHIELGLVFGKVIPAVLLAFLSFNIVFLVMGILMFLFFLFSMKLKNI